MDEKSAKPDRLIAQLAARQHGVVSTRQLRWAGLSPTAVQKRVRAGRLHAVHRGVHAVGYPPTGLEARWMAAVLAVSGGSALAVQRPAFDGERPFADGERAAAGRSPIRAADAAVLSHRSAAALWRLLPARDGPVDVSIPHGGGRQRRQGIRLHRCQSLRQWHMTRHRGIPVTTAARTIADLRAVVSAGKLRQAIRQAEVFGLKTGLEGPSDRTRSELEFQFLRLCKRYGLPTPKVNVPIGPLTVDFLWEEAKLVVETDGYHYHRGHETFENDHSRDLELRTRGYSVTRLSYRQVVAEPARVVRGLRVALKLPPLARL